MEKHLLPSKCAECVFYLSQPAPGGLCRRHAPSPGENEHELVHWPKVRPTDRCGDGEAVSDGSGASVTACGLCVHWERPNGEGVKPDYRWGLSQEWWEGSGYCTRRAPSPSDDEDRRVYWKVTHASDGCGDGSAVEA